ncbi:MAG: hypothetical protein MJY69_02335 [Bacteroidales bacterium]|nr:hypothetical protein [Bacteroidales bacterium]
MKKVVRYSIYAILIPAFCVGMWFLLRLTREEAADDCCTGIDIVFVDSLKFVTEAEIRNYISGEYGDCLGKNLDRINLAEIEDILESKTAIRNSEAWISNDGLLHIHISQRKPVLRFQGEQYGFYVDERGYIFPLHRSYTAPVPTVNGCIPVNVSPDYKGEAGTEEERQWILQMLALNDYIRGSRYWSNKIRDISVRQDRNLVLMADGTEASFIFGPPSGYEGKLDRMEKYFTHILPSVGEGFYKSVTVKYNKQIICRKDI